VCGPRVASSMLNTVHQCLYLFNQGASEKIKRENHVHLRQLAKQSTYVPFFCFYFICFSAFLGVSRQGEFENTRKKLSTFQKNSPGKYFFGGGIFFRGDFFDFFV
jgi:hypothetical protein